MLRKFAVRWLLTGLILALIGSTVLAREYLQGNDCEVAADEVIDGTVFLLCENLEMHGIINGNLMGIALRSDITGSVRGSVYLAGGRSSISGVIERDLHFGGIAINVYPTDQISDAGQPLQTINGGVLIAALTAHLHENVDVPGSLIMAGYQLFIDSIINQEVNFWGSALEINGRVNRDVYALVGNPESDSSQIETLLLPFSFEVELVNPGLRLSPDSYIGGILDYSGPVRTDIAGQVEGGTVFSPVNPPLPTLDQPGTLTIYFDQLIREATTLISIGLMGLLLAPGLLQQPMSHLRYRPVSSISVGMLAFILSFPVVLIMLVLSGLIFITLELLNLSGVALAVGAVLGLVNIGGISLFYFVAIFVARVLVGLALGRVVFRLLVGRSSQGRMNYVSMAMGMILLGLAVSLPFIGWIINAAALFLGLGSILTLLLERFRDMRENTPPVPPPVWYTPAARITRPLPVASGEAAPSSALLSRMSPRPQDIPLLQVENPPPEPESASSPQPEPDEPDMLPAPSPYDSAPGMDNLPAGFNFDFFNDDESDDDDNDGSRDND